MAAVLEFGSEDLLPESQKIPYHGTQAQRNATKATISRQPFSTELKPGLRATAVCVGGQGVVYRAGSSNLPIKMLVGKAVHSDLRGYDALAIVEWDVLVTVATDRLFFRELYHAAFHGNEKVLDTSSLAERTAIYYNSTDPASAEYAELTCGGGESHNGGESGITARSLSGSIAAPTTSSQTSKDLLDATGGACADFEAGENYPGSSWALDDCAEVWANFALSVPPWARADMQRIKPRGLPGGAAWREIAAALREAGSPCLVATTPTGDGVGSSAMRHLASWIFSEQMGCDWTTPNFGHPAVEQGNGTVEYCHKAATREEVLGIKSKEERHSTMRCTTANWLSYFQFDVPSVPLPEDETWRLVRLKVWMSQPTSATQSYVVDH